MKFQPLSQDEFIRRSRRVHGDKYNYSLSKYVGSHKRIKIICNVHGLFEQTPSKHWVGRGCPKCGIKKCSAKCTFSTNDFIEKSNKIHNGKYDYSLSKYVNAHVKVKIICPEHGLFEQMPMDHFAGKGCGKCRGKKISESKFSNKKEFIKKAKKIHKSKYNYSQVEYKKAILKVKIICKKHGEFEQTPNSHLNGQGCPFCKISKGEENIRNFLIKNKIKFERQKRFKGLKYKRNLLFDFYLPDYNLLIEFNGRQHDKYIKFFHKRSSFEIQKKRDKIKKQFARKNNINLIILRYYYDKNKIEKVLKQKLYL